MQAKERNLGKKRTLHQKKRKEDQRKKRQVRRAESKRERGCEGFSDVTAATALCSRSSTTHTQGQWIEPELGSRDQAHQHAKEPPKASSRAEGSGAGCRAQWGEMVRVSIRTPGTTRLRVVDLPAEAEVAAVRQIVAHELGSAYERLKLISEGKTLEDEKNSIPVTVKFVDGDSLIAMMVPKPPPRHISSRDGDIEDEDEDLKFKLPESATPLQRHLAAFLRGKLKVPDVALIVLFSISLRAWLSTILWFLLLPLARRWDLGPLYIITTIFLVIFLNLGKRNPGEASAYSIFNEDFRELPGTLNAERLDRDIRAGQF